VPDELARDRDLTLTRTTQLADDPLSRPGVQMNVLAGERRASAIHAAVAIGLQRPKPAAQQNHLELLDVG
jgi:hypothetical protein